MCDVHIWRKKRPDKSIDCAKEALRVSYIELNMIMIHEDEPGWHLKTAYHRKLAASK